MKKDSIKRIAAVALAGSLCISALAMAGCSGSGSQTSSSAKSSANSATSVSNSTISSASAAAANYRTFSDDELLSGKHYVSMQVEGYDPITIELDADAAPQTVTNFIELVNNGYYNGKTFYRVVDDFCLQGGTLGNSASGNDPSIKNIQGEFSENNVENPLADKFEYGTIAMARSGQPNSASSTFFITLGDNNQVGRSLDGKYAAFGTIEPEGMQTIDQIVNNLLENVDDPQMGAISDENKQAVIESIEVVS